MKAFDIRFGSKKVFGVRTPVPPMIMNQDF